MLELFREDLRRWVIPSQIAPAQALTWRTIVRLFIQHLPVRAMFLFRLGSWLKGKGVAFLPGWLQRVICRHYGLEIQVGADIGGGLYIAHPVGTVIMCKRIGKNASIVANVTIGMRNEWAFPEIGDDVFIGAGARVLGGIKVGDHARIGANAVVIQDVPEGATMVGIPARAIKTPQNAERA